MGWNYLSIPKLQRCNRWSLGMDKLFHRTLYQACDYLSMLGLKLNHVSKRGHRGTYQYSWKERNLDRSRLDIDPTWKCWIHSCQGYPGYFQEPHWISMGLPEISRVTWQVCGSKSNRCWSDGLCYLGQYGAVIAHQYSPKYSQQAPHNSHMRASYGVSVESHKSG